MMVGKILRRSQLVTPANRRSAVEKALVSMADSVILDLEDAVPAQEKAAARVILTEVLAKIQPTVGEVAVRINGLDTPWWLEDMQALCGLNVQAIVIPKVRQASDVTTVARVADQLEQHGLANVVFQPMIETPDAVLKAHSIGTASARNVALIYGVGDYIAETGMRFSSGGTDFARAQVALAAHACGLDSIDHVWPFVKDLKGLQTDAQKGCDLGHTGKWALHPIQIETIHAAFMPTQTELTEARDIIAAYQAALQHGRGAILVDGQLVDEAVLKIMNKRLAVEAASRFTGQ